MSRQPDFSSAPRRGGRPIWELAGAAVSLLVLAAVALAARQAHREALVARGRLAEVRQQVDRHAARVRALERAFGARSAAASAVDVPPARVVASLSAALPGDARLRQLSIDYSRGLRLEVEVEARTPDAWDRLLEGLERSPDLREVEPGPESREDDLHSRVRARWKDARP